MKALLVLSAATIAFAGAAVAQERTTDNPPAIAKPSDTAKTTAAPVAGKNSFTEDQAKERLAENGYKNISKLMKDANSIWRGEATTAAGAKVQVAVDYQGNITTN